MAQLVIDIPDAQEARVIDAMCRVGGYTGPDDEDARLEFTRQILIDFLRREVARVERAEATAAAFASVQIAPVDLV